MSKLQSSKILSSRIRNNSTLAKPPWAVVSYLVKAGGWRNDRKVHEYSVPAHKHSLPAFNLKNKT